MPFCDCVVLKQQNSIFICIHTRTIHTRTIHTRTIHTHTIHTRTILEPS